MFLDEPTSGLDAAAALRRAARLEALAAKRRAVLVATLHQPSSRVFATCASAAWAHTSDLIDGTRDDELAALASGDDEVVAILETLVASQAMWDGGRGPSAG